jgi:hypothetical protein
MDNEIKQIAIGGGEGFMIYTAEHNGKYLLIIDESTTLDMLSDEDAEGLTGERILEFDTEGERQAHLETLQFRPF